MEFTVQVLGCGDAFGSGGRLHTSYWLTVGNKVVLLDCGATISPAMKRQSKSTQSPEVILISHLHGDHYGGLPFFILEAAKVAQRTQPLTIIGPVGLEENVKALQRLLYPGSDDIWEAFPMQFLTLQVGEQMYHEDLFITAFEAIHVPEALPMSLRIEAGGKILAFSGDTSWTDALVPLSQSADLFICECNFFQGEHTSHLSYEILQQKLSALTAQRIIITHLGEQMLSHLDQISLEVAQEGQLYSIG